MQNQMFAPKRELLERLVFQKGDHKVPGVGDLDHDFPAFGHLGPDRGELFNWIYKMLHHMKQGHDFEIIIPYLCNR